MSTQEFIWSVNIPFDESQFWNTQVTRMEDGKEQRRKKWSQSKKVFRISLRGRTKATFDQVWDFYKERSGAYDTFYFENPNENPVDNELIGSGDGASTEFTTDNFPLVSGSPTAVKFNGTTIDSSNYTVTESTGTISFITAPSGGTGIRADYKFGRIVRFKEDSLTRDLFNYQLYNGDFELIEVL